MQLRCTISMWDLVHWWAFWVLCTGKFWNYSCNARFSAPKIAVNLFWGSEQDCVRFTTDEYLHSLHVPAESLHRNGNHGLFHAHFSGLWPFHDWTWLVASHFLALSILPILGYPKADHKHSNWTHVHTLHCKHSKHQVYLQVRLKVTLSCIKASLHCLDFSHFTFSVPLHSIFPFEPPASELVFTGILLLHCLQAFTYSNWTWCIESQCWLECHCYSKIAC